MKLFRITFALLVILMMDVAVFAQVKTISGIVTDTLSQERLPYAWVIIRNKQNTVVKSIYTDEKGEFIISFSDTLKGTMSFEMLGYQKRSFSLQRLNPYFVLYLTPKNEVLGEVTIKGKKGNVVKKIDRDVFKITKQQKNSANDVYDILSTLPGVVVDKVNGTIRFKGGAPEVTVDNMPAGFVYPQLQMINIEDIENIELIDRSSLYGGEGKGGIVNIKLKKPEPDMFGAFLSTANEYTPKDKQFSTGNQLLNLTLFPKYFVLFNNLNYKSAKNINTFENQGTMFTNGFNHNKNSYSKTLDDKRSLINYVGATIPSDNLQVLYVFGYEKNKLDQSYEYNRRLFNQNYDFNMLKKSNEVKTADAIYHLGQFFLSTQKWEVSLKYTYANTKGNSDKNSNMLYWGSVDTSYNYGMEEKVKNITHYFDSYLNYNLNSTSRLNLHFNYFNNDFPSNEFNYLIDGKQYLPLCKSQIKGQSNTISGIGYGKRWGRFSVDASLNYEYQKLDGDYIRYINQSDTNLLVDVNHHFFNPSIRFKQSLNKHHSLYLGYSYTGKLGDVDNYILFIDKQNPNYWQSGNPDLDPEYFHNAYFQYKYQQDSLNFSTELFYKTTLNGINNFQYPISPELVLLKPENMSEYQRLGADLSLWWHTPFNLDVSLSSIMSYNVLNSGNLSLSNEKLKQENFTSLVKLHLLYKLSNKTNIGLWLDYYPKEVNYYGTMQKPTFMAWVVSRRFFKDRLFINLSVENLLNVPDYKGTTDYMGVKETSYYDYTPQKFRVYFYIYYIFKNGDLGTKDIKGQ